MKTGLWVRLRSRIWDGFRSGERRASDSCRDVQLWQDAWGKTKSQVESQDLAGSLTFFLPISAWFWGCWLWLPFVMDESPKDPPMPPWKGP